VAISDGAVSWALISANPSNESFSRVWSFQLNGTLSETSRDAYVIEYNLDNVETEYVISFEGTAIGTLTLSNTTFVVNQKNLTFTSIDTPAQKRIVLHLNSNICPVKEGRIREFLLNFYLNDTTSETYFFTLTYDQSEQTSQYQYTATTGSSPAELDILVGNSIVFMITGMSGNDTIIIETDMASLFNFFISTSSYYVNTNLNQQSITFFQPQYIHPGSFFIGDTPQNNTVNLYYGTDVSQLMSIIFSTGSDDTGILQCTFILSISSIAVVGLSVIPQGLTQIQFQNTIAIGATVPNVPYFISLYDSSYNSVMCFVPTNQSDCSVSLSYSMTSGWTSSSITSSSFTALIQDSSLNFVTGFLSPSPCPGFTVPYYSLKKI